MSDVAAWADEWKQALHGTVTPGSAVVYGRSLDQFCAFLTEHYPEVGDLDQVTRRHVEAWLRQLYDVGRSANTRRVRVKALSVFFSYAIKEDSELRTNPVTGVSMPAEEIK